MGFSTPSSWGSPANVAWVVKAVATDMELDNTKRKSAIMYVEDLAEFARMLLATKEMTSRLCVLESS
jgi:hypothetical protein